MMGRDVQSPSRWDLILRTDTPDKIRNLLVERGHIMITEEWVDPRRQSDTTMKALSIYTGRLLRVTQGRAAQDTPMLISGDHLTGWLGDADGRGEVITVTKSYIAEPWDDFITDILPASIVPGVVTTNPTAVSADYFAMSRRSAIDHAAEGSGAEYRVNNDGTIDSGVQADLYVTTPTVMLLRKGVGYDPSIQARSSPDIETVVDAAQWVSELHIAGSGDFAGGGDSIIIGTADLADIAKANPYKDIHGNADATAVLVQDPISFADQGDARAQTLLGPASDLKETITLDADDYDIDGDFEPGDTVFAYDPPLFKNNTNKQRYGGQWVSPKAIRVFGVAFPFKRGMGAYYRDLNGVLTDFTQYVEEEDGAAQLTVGDQFRSPFDNDGLSSSGGSGVNQTSNAINTPAKPVHANTPWTQGVYFDADGVTRAQILVEWLLPLNTDGSVIDDGNHYTVRIKRTTETDYNYISVAWGTFKLLVQELGIGTSYDISIAAYDHAGNTDGYLADTTIVTVNDVTPPSKPAASIVAGSVLQIQVKHFLGLNSGGQFNLEADTERLEVYVDTSPSFTPDKGQLEVQTLYNNSTSGTFKITFDGFETSLIQWDSLAINVRSALTSLFSLSDMTVTGAGTIGDPWILSFIDPTGVLPQITTDDTGMDGTSTIATTTEGTVGNLVGSIPVLPGNLALEIPVIGTFQIPDTTVRYTKVIAVDHAGNASSASPEASVTAELIDTVNIADLAVTEAIIGNLAVTTAKIDNLAVDNAKIKDLAVDNAKINDLDAVKITAGFIDTDRLEARTITVAKLIAGSFDNLAQNPGFENDSLEGANDPHNYNTGAGGAWAGSTVARSGGLAARFDCNTYVGIARINVNGVVSDPTLHHYLGEGDEIYAEAFCRSAGSGTIPQVDVEIRWHDEDGNNISNDNGTNLSPTSSYQKFSLAATAPAGVAYFVVSLRVLVGGDATAAVLFDDIYVRRMVENAIVTTGLEADKITVGTLSGITIEGNTIQTTADGSDRIALESGDPDKIKFYNQVDTLDFQIFYDDANDALRVTDQGAAISEFELRVGGRITLATDDSSGAVEITPAGASGDGYATLMTSEIDVEVLRLHALSNTYTNEVLRILANDTAGFLLLRTRIDNDGSGNDRHRLLDNGDMNIDGSYLSSGGDYAEMFESADGAPIDSGLVVTLDGDQVRVAGSGDWALGVVSPTPTIIGNVPLNWPGKIEKDEWGREVLDREPTVWWHERGPDLDEGGRLVKRSFNFPADAIPEGITPPDDATWGDRSKLRYSPDFDESLEYELRNTRDEWITVGLMGRLLVCDDGTCQPNQFAVVGAVPGEMTHSDSLGWRVLRRMEGRNVVEVLVK